MCGLPCQPSVPGPAPGAGAGRTAVDVWCRQEAGSVLPGQGPALEIQNKTPDACSIATVKASS